MRKALAALLISVVLSSTGCVLVPVFESVSQMGVTQSDREALFARDMKKFNDAMCWGKPEDAAPLFSEENRTALLDALRKRSKDEHVVDSRIESIDFSDDSYSAKVAVTIKYYAVPYYIVNERLEQQEWRFKVPAGWRIMSREIKEG